VVTPTDNSIPRGMATSRVAKSHNRRKIAPPKAEASSRRRWDGPTSKRMMCGTIKPTNPIGPVTETMIAVNSEASSTVRMRFF